MGERLVKKLLRRVYRVAFGRDTLRALAEAAGFGAIALAGWMVHPVAGLLALAAYFLNLAYAPRSRK